MITWDEMAQLLAFMAAFDQRKGGEVDVKAWRAVAEMQDWPSAAVVHRVIAEHYAAGADRPRISPAAVTDRIRALRNRAAETFPAPRIPDGLSGADYPAWYRTQMRDHVDRCLATWVATGTEPSHTEAAEAAAAVRSVAELAAMAPEQVRAAIDEALARIQDRRP